jgi:hypothetical protein
MDQDDAFEEGGEVTRPHPALGTWKPLLDDLGVSDPEAKPLLETLRKAEEPHSDPSEPRKEPGGDLN